MYYLSLKNIGKFLNAKKDYTKAQNIAKDIGALQDAADALKNVKDFTDNEKIGILTGSGLAKDADIAKTALNIEKVGDAASESVESVSNLGLLGKIV